MGDTYLEALMPAIERLDRVLRRAVDRMVTTGEADGAADPFRGLYISQTDAIRLLDPPVAGWDPGDEIDEPPLLEILGATSPLAELARTHGLSSFDVEILVIALAPELDLRYERLYAFLQDDVSRRRPTVDLALTLLCRTIGLKLVRREHFSSDAPLLRSGLVGLMADSNHPRPPLLAHYIRLDEIVVRGLLGQGGLDPALGAYCVLQEPSGGGLDEAPVSDEVRRALPAIVLEAEKRTSPLHLYFSGPDTVAKEQTAAALAGALAHPLVIVDLGALVAGDANPERMMWTILREASSRNAIVYLDVDSIDVLQAPERALLRQRLFTGVAGHPGPVILAGTKSNPVSGVTGQVVIPFPIPDHDGRLELWSKRLRIEGVTVADADLTQLAGRYCLTGDQIADAVAIALNRARWQSATRTDRELADPLDATPSVANLFSAARSRSEDALAGLAHKIRPVHKWDQIILPDSEKAQLRHICQQVQQRHRVYDEWGFGDKLSLGRAVNALFAGPSGTGKTTAAEIIANELQIDLFKIDLANVVDKYVGVTEKNLDRIFTAATNANVILLFDEADALFGRRSEVRDSHDRYANIEISYLLQRMEQYEGIAILATNLRQNMDEAFVRRLQFVVEFPFPDEDQRAEIWRLLLHADAPVDRGVDVALFARQFRMTGGNITNVVLAAAFLAAAESSIIETTHLLRAVQREYQKMGKVITSADVEPFVADKVS